MRDIDYDTFAEHLTATLECYDKAVSATSLQIWFDDLIDYPIEAVIAGLKLHRKNPDRGQFAPKQSDVIREVQNLLRRKWLTADEAWAKALMASDENVTIVWTEEAQYAYGMASPILQDGDAVGARMAFKAAYERAVSSSIAKMQVPAPFVSLGHDQAGRISAVEEAVSAGLLTQERAEPYLIESKAKITEEGKTIAGLLTGNVVAHPSSKDHFRRKIAEVMAAANAQKSPEEIKAEADALNRADMERRRQEAKEALRGQA